MKSKTVLITGAAKGIGRAVAAEFAKNGWNIIAQHFSSDISETEKEIKRYGVAFKAVIAYIAVKGELEARLGGVVLIVSGKGCNHGITFRSLLLSSCRTQCILCFQRTAAPHSGGWSSIPSVLHRRPRTAPAQR